ncbi:MAG: acyl-CoA dehydratase activase [Desulfobacterales bacterium]|nr:acyl-CoA dehydratase activase [Desulfobacterales bacterium]
MKDTQMILGIDVGSVSVSISAIDGRGKPVFHDSSYHHGEVKKALAGLLEKISLGSVVHVAKTSSTPSFINADSIIDEQVAIIRSARRIYGDEIDAILYIGGEKFSLSFFDGVGNYTGAKHNTSCAAGTGSFLDQQAGRLHLAGSAEISAMALENQKKRPDIATRCAVFAKTDLIHAQQEGYDIRQICDGLCFGLAKNIANTLFKQKQPAGKVLFCGGVSKNTAVRRHLESITNVRFTTDEFSLAYGAMGAALCLKDELDTRASQDLVQPGIRETINDYFSDQDRKCGYRYPELELRLSAYPDFTAFASFDNDGVEVDVYDDPSARRISHGFLGLDVGSTSTKSILVDQDGIPVAGFYTKTASRPVMAVQRLFKACDRFLQDFDLKVRIKGCGTTGSGRRISAKIIGADIEPDEITAHATAAVNLNPDVDTIIEIGGQDAKFTLLRDGMVTSSVMNTVCAAGTGSFIEEQASKLDCPLSEYSRRTEGVTSPVSSDRCTVFMERDINYFFAEGYEKNEILASVLHSVRDNYLTKVANVAKIGNQVLFQGATARNKALVAAFEQKLQKPIHVSRYCHLTGALGVALMAMEMEGRGEIVRTGFRGFSLWREEIPVRQETCRLCTNHCKVTIADVGGSPQAYGFLCGRDYDTRKRVSKKDEYDLLSLRRKALKVSPLKDSESKEITVGLPDALHMTEDLEFWQVFFKKLGIRTRSSRHLKDPVKLGKKTAAAEFCAPVVALHGHVDFLLEKTDLVFLPFYFEDKTRDDGRRQHCYYTQFTPAILGGYSEKHRILSPTVRYLYTSFHTKMELYTCLKKVVPVSFFDVSQAFDRASAAKKKQTAAFKSLYQNHSAKGGNRGSVDVLLLGRPYTVLSNAMNNNIPGIFSNLGIKTFFQDMLDLDGVDTGLIEPLLNEIHWKHAADILKAALLAATRDDLYPVYISSFKCAPDSFGVDYFKEIMEKFNKPYLVLELDEHDSSVGYETRIEAAVRAFKNHAGQKDIPLLSGRTSFRPRFTRELDNKTIIFPNWDSITGHLIVNILKNEGYNAVLMEENEETLKKGLLTNTGQCLPLNAVAAGFIHTVKQHGLDPSKTALWLNDSEIACNIKMYPYHIQKIFTREGNGFEKAHIYKGELSLFDIGVKASTNTYFAYMFGGLFRSIGCKIRPYEINRGETDRALDAAAAIMGSAFLTGGSNEKALKEIMSIFSRIPRKAENRPKVGIFGDLYVRDNSAMNQDLIRFIEDNGGEVVTTPYYKYVQIIANSYFKKWFKEGKYFSLISNKAMLTAMKTMEKKYYGYFEPFLDGNSLRVTESYENILEEYGILPEHTGESMDNILKIHHIVREHPDLALLIGANPAFCCPGLVTEAMAEQIEKKVKVPIVSITYDLSGGNKNRVVVPFLKYLRQHPHSPQSRKVSV